MTRVSFNVLKCIVNISSQDFGVYGKRKGLVRVGSKAEQPAEPETAMWDVSTVILEVVWVCGGNEWWFWALLTFLDAGEWIGGLRSLLGWLWWLWEVLLEGSAEIGFLVAQFDADT